MYFKLLIGLYWLQIKWRNGWLKTRPALERYQQRKLRQHWQWLRQHSPYFTSTSPPTPLLHKERGDANVNPENGKGSYEIVDWLVSFPSPSQGEGLGVRSIMNKTTLMTHFDSINTVGISRDEALALAIRSEQERDFSPTINGITVGLSSGTSGNRGLFLASERERAKWVAAVLDRVIGLTIHKRRVAFFLRANSNLYTSVRSSLLQFEFFDLLREVGEHVKRLNQLQPDILIAQPSMLVLLAQAAEQGVLSIRPTKLISVAEVLEDTNRQHIERAFGQPVGQVYQCTEGFLGYTCHAGRLHLNEDFVHIGKRYLDEERVRFHPIITDFTRQSQPIVRYELNDILWEDPRPCPCGSPRQAILKIEGRSDDSFVLQNRAGAWLTIFPDFIRRAMLFAGDDLPPYVIEQTGPDQIVVHLATSTLRQDHVFQINTALQAFFEQKNLSPVTISFTLDSGQAPGQKLRRICRTFT
jgi:putative adenylate-forming enzyme